MIHLREQVNGTMVSEESTLEVQNESNRKPLAMCIGGICPTILKPSYLHADALAATAASSPFSYSIGNKSIHTLFGLEKQYEIAPQHIKENSH